MPNGIDDVDIKILGVLQQNAAESKANIARKIGLAPSAIHSRIRQLEERGVIEGYRLQMDLAPLGYSLLVFVFVTEIKPAPADKTLTALVDLDLAEEIHRISGEDCYLLKIRSRDTDDLREKLDRIGCIETVGGIRTHLVLQSAPQTKTYA